MKIFTKLVWVADKMFRLGWIMNLVAPDCVVMKVELGRVRNFCEVVVIIEVVGLKIVFPAKKNCRLNNCCSFSLSKPCGLFLFNAIWSKDVVPFSDVSESLVSVFFDKDDAGEDEIDSFPQEYNIMDFSKRSREIFCTWKHKTENDVRWKTCVNKQKLERIWKEHFVIESNMKMEHEKGLCQNFSSMTPEIKWKYSFQALACWSVTDSFVFCLMLRIAGSKNVSMNSFMTLFILSLK